MTASGEFPSFRLGMPLGNHHHALSLKPVRIIFALASARGSAKCLSHDNTTSAHTPR